MMDDRARKLQEIDREMAYWDSAQPGAEQDARHQDWWDELRWVRQQLAEADTRVRELEQEKSQLEGPSHVCVATCDLHPHFEQLPEEEQRRLLDGAFQAEAARWRDTHQTLRNHNAALQARVAALTEALKEYGRHAELCIGGGKGPCNCGFDAAIAGAVPPAPTEKGAEDNGNTQAD